MVSVSQKVVVSNHNDQIVGSMINCPYSQVMNRLHWIDWLRYSVTEFLFPPFWYNGKEYGRELKNYVADNAASKVLAMARVRQLRVKNSK